MTLLGIHLFLVKVISQHVTVPTIVFFNQLLIVLALFFYIHITDTPFLPEENIYLGYAILISPLMAIGLITLYMAIQRGPISVVIPIYSLSAVITAILGISILEEVVTFEKVLGLFLAVVAIILLSRS